MSVTSPATVLSCESVTPELRWLRLDVSPTLRRHFTTPGQYVRIFGPDWVGYFAMASAPGDGPFEFLVRGDERSRPFFAALSGGEALQLSGVEGRGYALDRVRGRDLLLVATGTGLAPIRSALLTTQSQPGAFGQLTLLFGAADEGEIPWRDELAAWEQGGVEVRVSLSRPGPGWQGARGYVQGLLPELEVGPGAGALLCGQVAMMDQVTSHLKGRGVEGEHILRNY